MTGHTKDAGDLQKLLADATPGPWSIDARKSKKDGSAYVYVSGGDWMSFARVWVRLDDEDFDSPDGLANASLIAMAPNLAAALILAKDALAGLIAVDDLGAGVTGWDAHFERARAAFYAINALEVK